jgi:type IV pilus assembly protein PilP
MERTRKRLKRNKLLARSLALVFLLAGFVTAAPAATPPAAKPAEVKPAAQQEAMPVAASPEMPDYRYDPKGKIDPFKPFVRLELPTPSKKGPEIKKLTGHLTPLQRVALDKVRVTGIAGSSSKRVAMVEDGGGGGKGYLVYVGTLIGENGGKVIQILPDRVIVEEKLGESKGKEKMHRVALKLHKEEGEGRP